MRKPVAWMQVHHKDNKPTKFSLVQTWEDDVPLFTQEAIEETKAIWYAMGHADGAKIRQEYQTLRTFDGKVNGK